MTLEPAFNALGVTAIQKLGFGDLTASENNALATMFFSARTMVRSREAMTLARMFSTGRVEPIALLTEGVTEKPWPIPIPAPS